MNSSIVCIGDSNTDANHFWSQSHPGLGEGYVYYLSQSVSHPDGSFSPEPPTVLNKGYDSLSAAALLSRLQHGIITIPECRYATLLIGINDIGISMNTGISLREQHFPETYEKILQILQERTDHLICMGPFVFSRPAFYQTWFSETAYANDIIEALAIRHNHTFLPLQSFFQKLELKYSVDQLTYDGIHLTDFAHRELTNLLLTHLT